MSLRKSNLWSFSGAVLGGLLLVPALSIAQPAKGANKFLGNITPNNIFMTYWNQITAENAHKWGSVEGTRNSMSWSGGDQVVNFAKQNNIPWKFHTLVWGSQYPSWITSLSQADQLKEITEWMDAAKTKYPDCPMIDVVNEAQPGHAPAPFKNALGGDGSTGFDWIIKSFQMARERWPKAILIYNDYNNCEYGDQVDWTYKLVQAMIKAKAPIDAIGCQAHDAWRMSASAVKTNIDKLATLGLPIFITEYDIQQSDDAKQASIMKEQFTMFWNHPKIVGITYWGMTNTWRAGTELFKSGNTERPAVTWLKDYVKQNPNPPNDFKSLLNLGGNSVSKSFENSIASKVNVATIGKKQIVIKGLNENAQLELVALNGAVVYRGTLSGKGNDCIALNNSLSGMYLVNVKAAAGNISKSVIF
jgi:endo-1,4-beta-xylanase